VICNNCFWAASLLKDSYGPNFQVCPICGKRELEVIPVSDYEYYKMNIDNRRGIDIEFVKEK
jgi:peptide subunit release factor 1 (eRF1)